MEKDDKIITEIYNEYEYAYKTDDLYNWLGS